MEAVEQLAFEIVRQIWEPVNTDGYENGEVILVPAPIKLSLNSQLWKATQTESENGWEGLQCLEMGGVCFSEVATKRTVFRPNGMWEFHVKAAVVEEDETVMTKDEFEGMVL